MDKKINVDTVCEMRCVFCGKRIPKDQIIFCSLKCKDKCTRSEGDPSTIDKELRKLMGQYRAGGWKGWEWSVTAKLNQNSKGES